MFTETHLADLTHLDSLVDNPFGSIAIPYVEALNAPSTMQSTPLSAMLTV